MMMEKPWENYGKMMMMAVVLVMMMMMSNIFIQIRQVRGTQLRCEKKKTAFGGTFSVGKKDNEADFYVTWKTVMKQFFLPEIVSRPV
jgi:hypothetical protein